MTDAEYESARSAAAAAGLDFGKYVRQLLVDNAPEKRAAAFEQKVRAEYERVRPKLPDMDPHDLHLIISTTLRPPRERRFFIRPKGRGYVF